MAALPFQLTAAQRRVCAEIAQDLARAVPMHRLLQGDMGSGKTVVAGLAAEVCIEAGLVVGTHAVIQDKVQFESLALAVIDEQHRFGVAQRLALRNKLSAAQQEPHLLMMTATEALDLRNATRTHAQLSAALQGKQSRDGTAVCVGLLHSRMAVAEKKAVMAAFSIGQMGVLVSTTVIEVGVDVPNASLIVIEHAERFGLSQSHQLRGRVGRGATWGIAAQASFSARARPALLLDQHPELAAQHRQRWLGGKEEFLKA